MSTDISVRPSSSRSGVPPRTRRRVHGLVTRLAGLVACGVSAPAIVAVVAGLAAVQSGCGGPAAAPDAGPGGDVATACAPSCGDRVCGDDGCGGTCGTCADGAVCTWEGACVPVGGAVDDCSKSCADLGFACGDHCGASCGACPAGHGCVDHQCVCAPTCGAASCEQDDGCGGTCGACGQAVSCADCALKLQVVGEEVVDGVLRAVTVALDYAPVDGAPAPSIADLQVLVTWPDGRGLRPDGDVTLTRVATGPAIQDAHKELYVDPSTGKPYRELDASGGGGAGARRFAFLVLSTEGDEPIQAGRWLILTFRLGPAFDAAQAPPGPYTFALVQREQTFAPPPADQALWGQPLGSPVVVWTDAPGGPHVP